METTTKVNILKKLNKIMSQVDFIAKDKKNAFHQYAYASEEAIKKTLHPLMVKEGVLLQLESVEQVTKPGELKADGKREDSLTEAVFRYTFWDIESGESLSGTFLGSGADKGDKGIWKAITGALKYILTSTFLIPTGDDSEAHNPTEQASKVVKSQSKPAVPEKFVKEVLITDVDIQSKKGTKGDYWRVEITTDKGNLASRLEYDEGLLPRFKAGELVTLEFSKQGKFWNWNYPPNC